MEEMREKLSINQQIEDLKSKNIRFEICSEWDARRFLEYNTYYYKIKQYLQAFDRGGKVDFAYLKELSTLDYHFRKMIIRVALDIEHLLKVKLIRDITYDDGEDGYRVVQRFFHFNSNLKDELAQKTRSSAAEGITLGDPEKMPVWQLVELLSFSAFCVLYKFYYNLLDDDPMVKCMKSTRYLRNAAAHNTCLLNTLKNDDLPYNSVNDDVYDAVDRMGLFSVKALDKKLHCRTMHEFVSMLYLFCLLSSDEALTNMRRYTLEGIQKEFKDRFVYHKDYFVGSSFLTSNYEFITKLIGAVIEKGFQ